MSLYDEWKQALEQNRVSHQKHIAAVENDITALYESIFERLGCPPEALSLLRGDGEEVGSPEEFIVDGDGRAAFQIALTISNGTSVLGTYTVNVDGVPASGHGLLVTVNGREVTGATDSFRSTDVQHAIILDLRNQIER